MTDIIIQGIGGRMGHALCEMIANRSDCRIVGLDSSYQVTHILITVFFQNVRGQITSQADSTIQEDWFVRWNFLHP